MDVYGACDFDYNSGEKWQMNVDYDYNHDCWVTECDFHYATKSEHYYESPTSCLQTHKVTYYIYDGNRLLFQKTGYSKYIAHRWETVESYEGDGVRKVVSTCIGCGIQEIDKYDKFGRWIYHWNGEEGQGWMRIFNVCDYVEIYFDAAGNRWGYWTGVQHALPHYEYLRDSCTQFGTQIMYCEYCGETEYDHYVEPSHKYYWDDSEQTYICYDCGLENEKGIDGNFVVEDLTEDYGNSEYRAGFFNRLGEFWEREDGYNFYIVLNYGMDNEEVVDVEYILIEYGYDYTGYAGSGMIILDMESLNAAIEEVYGGYDAFENVSLVFQVFDYNEYGEHSYLDHVLTFTRI